MMKYHTSQIQIPSNVTLAFHQENLWFQGPLGTINVNLTKLDPYGIAFFRINKEENQLEILINSSHAQSKCMTPSILSKIHQILDGISRGVFISLELVGVGFRAQVESASIDLKLGHSHPIKYLAGDSLRIVQKKPTEIGLYGIDKHHVAQSAAEIRQFRPPEPYKGKGVRYQNEHISLKLGKKK